MQISRLLARWESRSPMARGGGGGGGIPYGRDGDARRKF